MASKSAEGVLCHRAELEDGKKTKGKNGGRIERSRGLWSPWGACEKLSGSVDERQGDAP